ncbi:MAG: hypothetical protein B7X06_03855, partial [Verrucomicrobia bacterium 21-51-4]
RGTIYGAVAFFVLSFALYLGYLTRYERAAEPVNLLPEMQATEPGQGLTAMPSNESMEATEHPVSEAHALVSPSTEEAPAH